MRHVTLGNGVFRARRSESDERDAQRRTDDRGNARAEGQRATSGAPPWRVSPDRARRLAYAGDGPGSGGHGSAQATVVHDAGHTREAPEGSGLPAAGRARRPPADGRARFVAQPSCPTGWQGVRERPKTVLAAVYAAHLDASSRGRLKRHAWPQRSGSTRSRRKKRPRMPQERRSSPRTTCGSPRFPPPYDPSGSRIIKAGATLMTRPSVSTRHIGVATSSTLGAQQEPRHLDKRRDRTSVRHQGSPSDRVS